MSSDSESLSNIVSLYSLDLSKLKFESEDLLDERSFQKSLDELLKSYGSDRYLAYILLRNVRIACIKKRKEECVLYSPLEKIISKETIDIIFGDSPKYNEIKKSIDIANKYIENGKEGKLYLPRRLKDNINNKEKAEIDALVIARGDKGELFLYNVEHKAGLRENENGERYKKAHVQLFRSTYFLIYYLLKTKLIRNDPEFYTFSILYSRYKNNKGEFRTWYKTVYFFAYKNRLRCRHLYAYYVNNDNKSIEYQIPLDKIDMKKYVNYSKDTFEYKLEKIGIIPYLLGLGNYKNYKKHR
jgi:hypothetical protein